MQFKLRKNNTIRLILIKIHDNKQLCIFVRENVLIFRIIILSKYWGIK